MMTSTVRNNYWSMMKGIAILAVLVIHIPLSTDTNAVLASRQIVNFPVAMFMFLSGFFVKPDEKICASVRRLLFPYIIWSAIWCIISPPLSGKYLIIKYLTGGFSILYFLFVLIQLKLLTPLLIKRITNNKTDNKEWYKDPMWLITPFYLLVFSIIRFFWGEGFEKVNDIVAFDSFFPSWLLYYYLGIYCKYNKLSLAKHTLALSILISLYLSIAVAFWLNQNVSIHNFPYTQSKLTSMFLSISVILLFYLCREDSVPRTWLARIGEMSFGIYLLHIPVMLLCQKVVSAIDMPLFRHIYNIPIAKFAIVLFLTICILVTSYKLLPIKIVRFIGLK